MVAGGGAAAVGVVVQVGIIAINLIGTSGVTDGARVGGERGGPAAAGGMGGPARKPTGR